MLLYSEAFAAPLAGSKAACDGHDIFAMITSSNFALSAKVCFLRNSKAVLQEWTNAAVRQAFPFCVVDRRTEVRFHLVLLQWV